MRQGLLRELAWAYKDPISALREAIANALDQYEHEDAKDKAKTIWIEIDTLRKIIVIRDQATGIEHNRMSNFIAIGNESIDLSSGKLVGKQSSSYAKIHSSIGGHKHLGKLSYAFACKEGEPESIVEFRSNNGINGHILKMRLDGWIESRIGEVYDVVDTTVALGHIGLEVRINNVKEELLNIKEIQKNVSKWLGLRLAGKECKIILRDVTHSKINAEEIQVLAPEDLNTKSPDKIPLPNGGEIVLRLTAIDKPLENNIGIYVIRYWIRDTKKHYLCKGWVNCDQLALPISREDYHTHQEFENVLEEYLKANFEPEFKPEKDKQFDKNELNTINDMIDEIAATYKELYSIDLPILLTEEEMIGGLTGQKPNKKSMKEVEKEQKKTDEWEMIEGVSIAEHHGNKDKGNVGIDHDKRTNHTTKSTVYDGLIGEERGIDYETPGNKTVVKRGREKIKEAIETTLRPRIKVHSGLFGDTNPTVYMESAGEIFINKSRPGFEFVRVGTKYKHTFLDKMIRAILLFKSRHEFTTLNKVTSAEEYETQADNLWNKIVSKWAGIS